MFDYDYTEAKHFTRKEDKENSFFEWCKAVGIDQSDFPFEAVSGRFYKNKPVIFKVVSWGSYMASSGQWIIFIAYRFNAMKHTVQYHWSSGRDGKITGESKKSEWIGG